jgi:hypothetical protein
MDWVGGVEPKTKTSTHPAAAAFLGYFIRRIERTTPLILLLSIFFIVITIINIQKGFVCYGCCFPSSD